MAEGKCSFVLYRDLKFTLDKLTDDQAGKLFKHILDYVNDLNPIPFDFVIELSFEPIKQSLKRDLKKWENICERNRNNGSKGGRPSNPDEPKKPSGLIGNPDNPDEPKKADSDTDSEIDIETENENDIVIKNVIEYLNSKSGKNFKTNSKTTIKHIQARINDKYTFEDFKKVIDMKCIKWLNDPKMNDYIRPETLFGSKFESYLNECIFKPKIKLAI